jgi:isoleucyl-tRNA synthetase
MPEIKAALAEADASQIVRCINAGESIKLSLFDSEIELLPEEIKILSRPAANLTVATERGTTVAIDTVVTPELRAEGLAREVVRRIQQLRKDADLRIEDRIQIVFQANDELAEVFNSHKGYIAAETLSDSLLPGDPAQAAHSSSEIIDGKALKVGISRR